MGSASHIASAVGELFEGGFSRHRAHGDSYGPGHDGHPSSIQSEYSTVAAQANACSGEGYPVDGFGSSDRIRLEV